MCRARCPSGLSDDRDRVTIALVRVYVRADQNTSLEQGVIATYLQQATGRGSTWNQVDDDQAAWMMRNGRLDQVLFERIACGSTARGDLDFPIDRLQVGVDRARTDDELLGDLGVSQSLRQQA